MNCRWRSGQNFPRWIRVDDRFTAANLNPALARPGQEQTVTVAFRVTGSGCIADDQPGEDRLSIPRGRRMPLSSRIQVVAPLYADRLVHN